MSEQKGELPNKRLSDLMTDLFTIAVEKGLSLNDVTDAGVLHGMTPNDTLQHYYRLKTQGAFDITDDYRLVKGEAPVAGLHSELPILETITEIMEMRVRQHTLADFVLERLEAGEL